MSLAGKRERRRTRRMRGGTRVRRLPLPFGAGCLCLSDIQPVVRTADPPRERRVRTFVPRANTRSLAVAPRSSCRTAASAAIKSARCLHGRCGHAWWQPVLLLSLRIASSHGVLIVGCHAVELRVIPSPFFDLSHRPQIETRTLTPFCRPSRTVGRMCWVHPF
jgi:hypothetical protein